MFNWFKKKKVEVPVEKDRPSILSSMPDVEITDYEDFVRAFSRLDHELLNFGPDALTPSLLMLGLTSTRNAVARTSSAYTVTGMLTYIKATYKLVDALVQIQNFAETRNSEIANFVVQKRKEINSLVAASSSEAITEIHPMVKNFLEKEQKVLQFTPR